MRYVETGHMKIADVEAKLEGVNKLIDDYIFDVGLNEHNALRLRLLSEEVMRLAKSIIGYGILDFWLEGTSRVTSIHLECQNNMDKAKQEELISVSTSGENESEQGFFGILKSMFLMQGVEDNVWSLKDYQEDIARKRCEDKYSEEAWDDLERSLVANLADDIVVSIDKKIVKMVVTKDFSEALGTIGSKKPAYTSQYIFIDSENPNTDDNYVKADEYIEEMGLTGKDAIHLKLLFEETVGMLAALAADYHAAVWFEKYKHEACVRVTAKSRMDQTKKENLLNVASLKGNALAKGFMGKVADIIENGLLNYENVMKLQQEYGGTVINYGTMGLYSGVEGMADSGVMWSLYEYKDALREENGESAETNQAWDELEKSIVASLAKDVLVGVKGDRIDMTIVCDI